MTPPNPWDGVEQLSDDAIAGSPWFFVDTYVEFQKGLEALLKELESHQSVVQLLGLESSPYEEEVGLIRSMASWGKERLDATKGSPRSSITVSGVTFGSLRYLKAGILYRAYLVEKQKREFLAKAKIVPRSVLRSFDVRIEQLRNMGEMGKLSGLRPAEVLFELLEASEGPPGKSEARMEPAFPTPTTAADIPVVDPVLRRRCLPILGAIEDVGSPDQYDTVIREMSVVLEDRVRELTGFLGKTSGAELFSATMVREPCLIRFSTEKDVQEAAHLILPRVLGAGTKRSHASRREELHEGTCNAATGHSGLPVVPSFQSSGAESKWRQLTSRCRGPSRAPEQLRR